VVTVDRDIVYKYLQVSRQSKRKGWKPRIRCKIDVLLLAILKDYAVGLAKDGRLLLMTLGSHFNDVRKAEWFADGESRLPRFVKGYVYDMVEGSVAVGNFCNSDDVLSIETHVVTKLGEKLPNFEDEADRCIQDYGVFDFFCPRPRPASTST